MKFCEKLSILRKQNNLSQEQLADKLGVSRQSISKWESDAARPDMEKIIQICKILNCNLEDILDDGVIGGKVKPVNVNYLNEILNFITKVYNMFWSMTFKEKIKCLFEMSIILLLLLIMGFITVNIIEIFILRCLYEIPAISYQLYSILSYLIILILFVFGSIIFIHLFKIRYLDYFITIEDESVDEKIKETEIDEKKNNPDRSIIFKPKEKVIIRDPKHSIDSFLHLLWKFIILIIKFFTVMICCPLIFFTVGIIMCFVILIYHSIYGSMFFFLSVAFLGLIALSFILLYFFYNFIFNRNQNHNFIFKVFILGILLIGIGSGLGLVKFLEYDNKIKLKEYVENIEMKDNLYFMNYNSIEIDNSLSNVKMILNVPENYSYKINRHTDNLGNVIISVSYDNENYADYYKMFKKKLKENKLYINNKKPEIKLYMSQENFNKIMANMEK